MHTVGIMVVKDNGRKRFYNKKMIVVLMVVLVSWAKDVSYCLSIKSLFSA